MLGHDGTQEPPEKGDSRQTDVGQTLQRAHFHEFRRRFVISTSFIFSSNIRFLHRLIPRWIFLTIDKTLPAVALPVGEGRENLWGKTREAYRHVWENYRDKADWFMKADDDT